MAKAHHTTKAVALLAWLRQNRVAAVTTTTKLERLDGYPQAVGTKLTEEELHEISKIGSTYHFRTSWPDRFEENDQLVGLLFMVFIL